MYITYQGLSVVHLTGTDLDNEHMGHHLQSHNNGCCHLPTKNENKFMYETNSRVAMKFHRQNSRIIQGYIKDLFAFSKGCSNSVQVMWKCRAVAPILRISMSCIVLNAEFKDFKDHFQNSRTFQVSSRISLKFKDFKDFFKDVATLNSNSNLLALAF